MKLIDLFLLFLLIVTFGIGVYVLYLNFPEPSTGFEELYANASASSPNLSGQFFPNMRFTEPIISYSIEENCIAKKKEDALLAFQILQAKTILKFYQKSDMSDIQTYCSKLPPIPDQEKYYAAGEGGPTKVINATNFYIISKGEISLFEDDQCETPQIALHEIIHALGFEHNKNESSIMFPITNCRQVLDQYIVDEINRVYSIPSYPDLAIEKLSGNKTGRYLSFEIRIVNNGLKDASPATLNVYANGVLINKFDIDQLDLDKKERLAIKNLRIPKEASIIKFEIQTAEKEISKENNIAEIELAES